MPLRGGEPVILTTTDGGELRGEILLPPSRAPAVVVALSHAMMVDRRTLDQPATRGLLSQLVAAGAAVFWFDQRGHGQSRPTPIEGGDWTYDTLVEDAGVVAAYLAERFPTLPRVAIGHSLFGHVALAYQGLCSGEKKLVGYDGLVLIGANIWLPELEPRRWRWWLKRLTFWSLLAATMPLGYLPIRRLRMGTADEPYAYLAQMGSWLAKDDWCDERGKSYRDALPSVQVPILSVAGAADRLMAVPECQLRLAALTKGPLTHRTVGTRFGDALDPDHMGLVLDGRLIPLWQEIAAWTCRVSKS